MPYFDVTIKWDGFVGNRKGGICLFGESSFAVEADSQKHIEEILNRAGKKATIIESGSFGMPLERFSKHVS